MSCGQPHETDCAEILDHLYEYLDSEMSDEERAKFGRHLDECSPCLEKYGLEQSVKKLVKRCCGHDDVPGDLRSKVMRRIEGIRAGEVTPSETAPGTPPPSPAAFPIEPPLASPDATPAPASAPARTETSGEG
ncbi:mycothiol system anti-sigma-R factor [Streptomyces sp. ST2-7A]|nr:mycothiol system anti-sigma-R factor [Streptomyces sp. ST2-7A]MCE7081851.1 mycothiol system anti-sigma-R factor [Streptomyces sp. ST2-7A]